VAWSPNSLLVASGSLDTTIIIWSVANPAKHTIIKSEFLEGNQRLLVTDFPVLSRCPSAVADHSVSLAGQQHCDLHRTGLQHQSVARGKHLNGPAQPSREAYFYTYPGRAASCALALFHLSARVYI